jgi:hypothetical protein
LAYYASPIYGIKNAQPHNWLGGNQYKGGRTRKHKCRKTCKHKHRKSHKHRHTKHCRHRKH